MKEIKTGCTKGTRILLGDEKREFINRMIRILIDNGFQEISIPILQEFGTFKDKVGDNQKMMYTLEDQGGRELCLAPEYTAVIMNLAKTEFKYEKDVKLFYVQECFRGEKPQAGRYRQFTQLGVEILNPTNPEDWSLVLKMMEECIRIVTKEYDVNLNTKRGLDYYIGNGFEIKAEKLGAQKQICGGGQYPGGIGAALGIDRLLLL